MANRLQDVRSGRLFISPKVGWLGVACLALVSLVKVGGPAAAEKAAPSPAASILEAADVSGGLVVHLGCGDGSLTASLRVGRRGLVEGLDSDPANVEAARENVRSQGLYGDVSVDHFGGKRLPYVDNLVNLLVAEDLGEVSIGEVMRALSPNGVALIKGSALAGKAEEAAAGGEEVLIDKEPWRKLKKARPAEIDEWTHYLHDASNNAVAHDEVVGPPRRMQWVGGPRYGRHHDRMSSVSAVVSAGGRVFTIFDEAPPVSILAPSRWSLIARDAFNGTILWKRPIDHWFTHLWPLKSGPSQLPRRLVADGDRVFVTLGLDAPLEALNAATGETVRTYDGTRATEEAIFSEGLLFVLVNDAPEKPDYDGRARFAKGYKAKFWDELPRKLLGIRAESGEVLWSRESRVLPGTLATDGRRVVFHDGARIVCLDPESGQERWTSEPMARSEEIRGFYLPILVLYKNVVLFSGGETAGLQTGSWYESGEDTLKALSAETGEVLWTAYHPPSGYRSPEDLLVADGLVWTGETTSGRAVGVFTGRDPQTGEVKREFPPDVDTYWFHHRCYRGKATDKYLITSRTGTEFIDVRDEHWIPHHWVRGACLYGVMPANGLLYAPQHPCACYLESKMAGFNALAAGESASRGPNTQTPPRLERGPAYESLAPSAAAIADSPADAWPTYRHDAARSGRASTRIPTALRPAWKAKFKTKLSSPVIAEGKVFVAAIDQHMVAALDAASGKGLWQFTAGGRIDSPPTIFRGRVLFGSADGHIYCLRATDGALAWRFRAAPIDQRLMAFEQIESVWPVSGSVLVENDVLYCVAGRSMFLDGGLRLLRLDPATGRLLSETILGEGAPVSNDDVQSHVSWLNMPVALPDVLSSDGRLVYMRSQPFGLDGTRLPLEAMPAGTDADRGAPPATQNPEHAHLFSPTGFLDDTWWHRTYWLFGSRFVSGWCGYFLSGKVVPAGRILVFDDDNVYGFGRKPKFYRWTTPIEHQLFAADKRSLAGDAPEASAGGSVVRVEKSASLNPAEKPITVEAWVKAERPDGVILAHGGGAQGYTLFLKRGRPHFALRLAGGVVSVAGEKRILGRWAHLAGVLTPDRKLELFVDGKLAASAEAPSLLKVDPHESLQIGADEGSTVGPDNAPVGFTGLVDEVRLYHRARSAEQIASRASDAGDDNDKADLVLAFSFEKPGAVDASGSENHGTVENAKVEPGKVGGALRFTGRARSVPGYTVAHGWTQDLPLFARAMVLADGTLFIAGPADLVDEEETFGQMTDPAVDAKLAEQTAVFEGNGGAMLRAVSAVDGETLAEHPLDSPPVFDGLAAASGRLYLVTLDGSVVCLAGK